MIFALTNRNAEKQSAQDSRGENLSSKHALSNM